MNDMNKIHKDIALYDELETSIKLIQLGFGELQNISGSNDFYFLPFQLLSSGFERLMKCHICLGYYEKHNQYPNQQHLKRLGHDLISLTDHIIENFFATNNIPLLEEDLKYLKNNSELRKLIGLLSEFGKFARYYNLDIVSGATNSIDIKSMWQDFETEIFLQDYELKGNLSDFEAHQERSDSVTRNIIIFLEKFTSALSKQFTLGQLGKKAQQFSPVVFSFIKLVDKDFGCIDYRNGTTRYKIKERKIHKRNIFDELNRKYNKEYKSKRITKSGYHGDWPFYADEVIIECREKHWCIVTIDGKDYALNGAAKGRYKIEDAHEAGMAILGKSVGPLIDIAFQLGKN